jgi:hypothetical protein
VLDAIECGTVVTGRGRKFGAAGFCGQAREPISDGLGEWVGIEDGVDQGFSAADFFECLIEVVNAAGVIAVGKDEQSLSAGESVQLEMSGGVNRRKPA